MLIYPNIDPVALQIGQVKIHWYGMAYVVGIVIAWLLALYRARIRQGVGVSGCAIADDSRLVKVAAFTTEEVGDLICYGAFGIILGGRLGYIFFYYLLYNFPAVLANPWLIFKLWEGGMSFHGGLIGVAIALWLFAKKTKKHWLDVADFVAPLVPVGLFLGRIGNFINGELRGRVTDMPWGVIFPDEMVSAVAGVVARHPSQLYEALLEGVVLFIVLWFGSADLATARRGKVTAWFLIGYGCIRFFCEFFREPDNFIGFIAFSWLTMGQLLSLPMMVLGIWIMLGRSKK